MNPEVLSAFVDELQKIAYLHGTWERVADLTAADHRKQERRVNYFFSDRAGPDKWDKFSRNIKSPEFLQQLVNHEGVDDKLKTHAEAMHALANGEIVEKVQSTSKPGLTYEVRRMGNGNLGCTCNDWRFRGSVAPGYKCKHIIALEGKSKVGGIMPLLARRFWEGKLSDDIDTIIAEPRFDRAEFHRSQI